MKIDLIKKTRKHIIIILILSTICLSLISVIPWFTIAEQDRLKEDLHFNYEMMKSSDNAQIQDLAGKLNLINILFWAMIGVALLSFIFIIYYASLKSQLFGPLMMIFSGNLTFVLSAVIVYFQIIFIRSINDINNFSISMMHPRFAYAYIIVIISIILLVFSTISTIIITSYSIKQLKNLSIQKEEKIKKIDEKEIPKKSEKKEIEISTKKSITDEASLASNMAAKISEMEKWLEKNTQSTDKKTFDEKPLKTDLEKEKTIKPSITGKTYDSEVKKPEKTIQSKETIVKEDESSIEPFPTKKPKEKSEEIDKKHPLQSFEKTIPSTIKEKDKKQVKTIEPATKEIEELKPEIMFLTEKILLEKEGDTIKQIFNVRCPQCNNIFSFDKEGDSKKITCPKCGKKGTAKKEF